MSLVRPSTSADLFPKANILALAGPRLPAMITERPDAIHREFTPSWVMHPGASGPDNRAMDKTVLSRGLPGRRLT